MTPSIPSICMVMMHTPLNDKRAKEKMIEHQISCLFGHVNI
jgi:hypothetical protein